jgi:hypothetical protein
VKQTGPKAGYREKGLGGVRGRVSRPDAVQSAVENSTWAGPGQDARPVCRVGPGASRQGTEGTANRVERAGLVDAPQWPHPRAIGAELDVPQRTVAHVIERLSQTRSAAKTAKTAPPAVPEREEVAAEEVAGEAESEAAETAEPKYRINLSPYLPLPGSNSPRAATR